MSAVALGTRLGGVAVGSRSEEKRNPSPLLPGQVDVRFGGGPQGLCCESRRIVSGKGNNAEGRTSPVS